MHHAIRALLPVLCASVAFAQGENDAQRLARETHTSSRDLSIPENKTLYAVGYAHLDTQWRWDFPITIDRYIKDTLDQNFERFEAFPDYTFSFTGSVRYEMMEEYYPEKFETLKLYIADGRWFVSGSSVDEGDVNVPSPESLIRQILYGNAYFRKEFGKESVDFMLPDCFGFPASMPTIWSHCGLLGFSTQKLTWGSAVGIPFKIGVWEGPNGHGVIAALDPGAYVGAVEGRVDLNETWAERVRMNGERFGVYADYHYYGVGDTGGAPREQDVRNYTASLDNPDSLFSLRLAPSDEMYKDITPEQREGMPRFKGDMLLTEHSAGTITSQSYMKRWNRKGEKLADAAERAAVAAHLLAGTEYPREALERGWVRLLANQMHDILPGTSLPIAYNWSWNDEVIALNRFATVLTDSVSAWSAEMDTRAQGVALAVYNPLAHERTSLVEATVPMRGAENVKVFGPDGSEVPSQMLEVRADSVRVLFRATVPSVGLAVYDVRPSEKPYSTRYPSVAATETALTNPNFTVTLDDSGDIAQITSGGREMLASPAGLVFTHESPAYYPAWNMDWDDRNQPPIGRVEGPARVRVLENGPLRASVEVTRESMGSVFTQIIRLTHDAGEEDEIVRIDSEIDWQTTGVALKASFPLNAKNNLARYNWGVGTIERGTNDPKKYEVPSHEWFSLTDASGVHGVTILEDSKFGSDKPSDNELRLTLLYSPEVSSSFQDQHSQDWGIHDMSYAICGTIDPVESTRQGQAFNQPMRVFLVDQHDGPRGRRDSLLTLTGDEPVGLRALKLAEESGEVIARVHELAGEREVPFELRLASGMNAASRVDGQERRLGDADTDASVLSATVGAFGIESFAIDSTAAEKKISAAKPLADLPFNADAISFDRDRADGAIDRDGRTMPGEMLPETISSRGVEFGLGPTADGTMNAVECRGQTLTLPGSTRSVHLLLAADSDDDVRATFLAGVRAHDVTVQPWTGFVGQWDNRVWESAPPEIFFSWEGRVAGIEPAFIRRDPIAWFATHRHHPENGNEAYRFSYLFHQTIDLGAATRAITLPDDPRVKIFAVSVSAEASGYATPASPLYDDFGDDRHIEFRYEYPPEDQPAHTGLVPSAKVRSERVDTPDGLTIASPSKNDAGQRGRFVGVDFRGEFSPHGGSGMLRDGTLPRLNDGEIAQNSDDTRRCVWYDREGRFTTDLRRSQTIERINTFSWHVSNRAPQYFSLWGSNEETEPNAAFETGEHGGWSFIAVVDTRELGDGGVHASSVTAPGGGVIGPYRHLLWIAENLGQGTFFMEIDVHVAE